MVYFRKAPIHCWTEYVYSLVIAGMFWIISEVQLVYDVIYSGVSLYFYGQSGRKSEVFKSSTSKGLMINYVFKSSRRFLMKLYALEHGKYMFKIELFSWLPVHLIIMKYMSSLSNLEVYLVRYWDTDDMQNTRYFFNTDVWSIDFFF